MEESIHARDQALEESQEHRLKANNVNDTSIVAAKGYRLSLVDRIIQANPP
jgi:hypothetical protein